MSEGLPYADVVILALIAGFILLRLRSVLGQKIGHDLTRPPEREAQESPIVQLVQHAGKPPAEVNSAEEQALAAIESPAVRDSLKAISAADRDFSLTVFMTGAKAAFEMVFDAFHKQDSETLKMLLSKEIFALFAAELERRKSEETYSDTTLLAVVSSEITQATLVKNIARIGVRFVSEQVTLVRDRAGALVQGDPASSENAESEWVFERDVSSRNPNWKIIDT